MRRREARETQGDEGDAGDDGAEQRFSLGEHHLGGGLEVGGCDAIKGDGGVDAQHVLWVSPMLGSDFHDRALGTAMESARAVGVGSPLGNLRFRPTPVHGWHIVAERIE